VGDDGKISDVLCIHGFSLVFGKVGGGCHS